MSAVLIRANGRPLETQRDTDLESMQKAVGGYLEWVRIDENTVLLVDENARVSGRPRTVNLRASMLAGQDIVGDAVLVVDDPAWT